MPRAQSKVCWPQTKNALDKVADVRGGSLAAGAIDLDVLEIRRILSETRHNVCRLSHFVKTRSNVDPGRLEAAIHFRKNCQRMTGDLLAIEIQPAFQLGAGTLNP